LYFLFSPPKQWELQTLKIQRKAKFAMKRLFTFIVGCIIVIAMGSASGCNETKKVESQAPETAAAPAPEPEKPIETAKPENLVSGQPLSKEILESISKVKGSKVRISTSFGDMIVVLYDETPKHRDNFLKLAGEGFYNGLLFHRVMRNFMIQGGDPDSKNAPAGKQLGVGGPGYNVDAEFNPKFFHKKGALAAARQPDQVNPMKKSSGSQFYIVQGVPQIMSQLNLMSHLTDEQRKEYVAKGGYPSLDKEYTVFGEVIYGMEVIDKIAAVQVGTANRPTQDVIMNMEVIK
jgi:cyclophilin family peptidyl-prolyl cis-trans isomerase